MADNLKEREAFEAWYEGQGDRNGFYIDRARQAWNARSAVEASRAAVPAALNEVLLMLAAMYDVADRATPLHKGMRMALSTASDRVGAMLAAAPQQVAQLIEPQYLCKAWGETDLPAAAVVSGLDGVRAFLVEQWLGDADHEDYDGTKTLPAAMADMQTYWETEGECWSIEFEIGGVSVQKVFHAAPSQVSQAKPEQAAQQWRPIETCPVDELVLFGPTKRMGICAGMNHSRDGWVTETCSEWMSIYPPKHWMPLPTSPNPKD